MSRLALLVSLAALAASAAAQQPQAPRAGVRQVRIELSPAGEAVVKKYLGTPDPVIAQGAQQLRALGQQLAQLTSAPKLDLARIRALMRQQEALQGALQRRGNERTLALLVQLSDADRTKFVQSLRAAQQAKAPSAAR